METKLRLTESLLLKDVKSNTAIGSVATKELGKLIVEAVNNYPKLKKLIKDITDFR